MPSVSDEQARFMRAAAHDSAFAKRAGISQRVAKEFVSADKSKKAHGRAPNVRHMTRKRYGTD